MKPGDGVLKVDWDNRIIPGLFGIVLDVNPDPKELKNPFGTPWIYRVLWNDGTVKDQGWGTIRRIIVK